MHTVDEAAAYGPIERWWFVLPALSLSPIHCSRHDNVTYHIWKCRTLPRGDEKYRKVLQLFRRKLTIHFPPEIYLASSDLGYTSYSNLFVTFVQRYATYVIQYTKP